MRSTLGTSLALASVLIAGTAAAAVNTQALTQSTKVSPIGVGATVLLPPTDVQVIDSAAVITQDPDLVNPELSPTPEIESNTSSKTQSPVIKPSPSSLVVYGNPNPGSTNDDDEDDDYDNEDDKDGDDD